MVKVTRDAFSRNDSSLTTIALLGRGSFGSVSLQMDSKFRLYAKKSSSLNHMKNLEKELRIMFLFRNHPRFVEPKSPYLHLGLKDCSIYMEFASEGTLDKMISDFGGKALPDNFIGRFTRMILEGLESLHARDYVHCDLKPANILLFPSTTFGEPYNLKLADFGLSKKSNTYSRSGTETYMPPESFESDGVIGPAFDIWSLGCVVFEMFGGKPIKMEDSDSYVWRLY